MRDGVSKGKSERQWLSMKTTWIHTIDTRKIHSLDQFNEMLRDYVNKEKRQPLLLAIDEAQYLNTGILNDIKMLMNYGYDSLNCFTLILYNSRMETICVFQT